jgi:hypothetical protein
LPKRRQVNGREQSGFYPAWKPHQMLCAYVCRSSNSN